MIKFLKNGYYDKYPHSDFEHSCTCAECCMDEENGYIPRCGVCEKPLRAYGLCTECINTPEGKEYIIEN